MRVKMEADSKFEDYGDLIQFIENLMNNRKIMQAKEELDKAYLTIIVEFKPQIEGYLSNYQLKELLVFEKN